ncbi:MAG: hypothetical protein LC126_03585 [Bryobacterales bacterium]|nr:hypothetical protein [Bryobacterales bacterium]
MNAIGRDYTGMAAASVSDMLAVVARPVASAAYKGRAVNQAVFGRRG